jgi:hypothetical protein
VIFTNNDESTYLMKADGTFVNELYSTSNLLLSDGGTRRVLIPVDLTGFDPNTLVHEAKLVLHFVPDSFVGEDRTVTLYAPESADVDDPAVLDGTPVTSTVMIESSGVVTFSIRNILALLLAREQEDNALVLQFSNEGASVRRTEFYGSGAAEGLRPYFTFTYSTAPDFRR